LVTLACEIAITEVPDFGPLLAKLIVPLVACGLLYAAVAADRGERPLMAYAIAAFRAPGGAIIAIVAASLLTFAAEAFAAWWIAGVNLLSTEYSPQDLSSADIAGIYAIGILASLPITFIPFHVLFERVSAAAAFAASWNAFMLNMTPLLVYAAASLVLLGFGLLTMGIGLVLVLPLWAASSYVAWKDVFGIHDAPGEPPPQPQAVGRN
jgi:hypothetical protein